MIVAAQPVAGAWLQRRDHTLVLTGGIVCTGLGFGLTALASATWQYAACVAVWTFSLGYLIAPIAGTRLLAHGGPALWLSCAAACAVAAAWQLALGPAIRRREGDAGAVATGRSG